MDFDKAQSYQALLQDLEQQKDEIEAQIFIIKTQLKKLGIDSPSVEGEINLSENKNSEKSNGYKPKKEIEHDTFHSLSILEAAKRYLGMVGKPARSTTEIVENLNRGGANVNHQTLYVTLARAARKRDLGVDKVGKGNWGLQEWYS